VTTRDFVTEQLRERFGCAQAQARHLMYSVHLRGVARVAESSYGDARARVELVKAAARERRYPLKTRVVHAGGR
jgi:ATP-dependent Clp protease adapter protein ClpS